MELLGRIRQERQLFDLRGIIEILGIYYRETLTYFRRIEVRRHQIESVQNVYVPVHSRDSELFQR